MWLTDKRFVDSLGAKKRAAETAMGRSRGCLTTKIHLPADELVCRDHEHGTSITGDIPPALKEGCTDAERDAVRAYARREWITIQERWPGS